MRAVVLIDYFLIAGLTTSALTGFAAADRYGAATQGKRAAATGRRQRSRRLRLRSP